MTSPLHVLIIEDSETDYALLTRVLRRANYHVNPRRVDSAHALRASLGEKKWNLVVSDFSMPGFSGVAALAIVREQDPDIPFIFFSGTIGEDTAVAAMRMGAQDYVLKSSPARLIPAVQRELAEAEVRREHRVSEQKLRQLEKFEALGKLAGGIAHDFNNVLAAIMGWAELGLDVVSKESPAEEYFRRIQNQSERAAGLTRQLLAYGRRQILQRQNVNVNEIVAQAAALLERVIGEHIEVQMLLAQDLWLTGADPTQIEQVLLNLCFNARDAMPDGGRLTIETQNVELDESSCGEGSQARPGSYVRLSVSDIGTGMDAATIENIFQPFFTTKEIGKGTGLGLATAFGIVKQHQGHIEVSSELGQGSNFRVFLPRSEAPAEPQRAPESPEVCGGRELILVAEDHEGVREMSQQVLQQLGYQVLAAVDGEDAIQKFDAKADQISLAVLDVVMPKLSGLDVYAEFRRIKPELPVIFTTGYTEQWDLLRTLAAESPKSILQKPYAPKALARRIREILDRVPAT